MDIPKRILVCTEHCLADPVSGAAISALELLGLLEKRGWQASVLCGERMDGDGKTPVGAEVRRTEGLAVHHTRYRDIGTRIVRGHGDQEQDREKALGALVLLLEQELERQRPDILMTYGGRWCGRAILRAARRTGVPTVFWLRNTLYQKKDLFDDVTGGIVVPSAFLARHYSQALSLRSDVLYSTVVRDRVKCHVRQPKYLTFVSPLPEKGVGLFARIVSELGRLRPDIEVLIVEGRGNLDWIRKTGLDVLSLPNVRVMGRQEDPRQFLAVTRALLFPSVWPETFGRTMVEAMVNGVPVVGSERGAIPEIVGSGGVLLPVPQRLTSDQHGMTLVASVAEVRPWVEAITRLWDFDEQYKSLGRSAVSSAARFDPDIIANRADTLLRQWSEAEVSRGEGDPLEVEGVSAAEVRGLWASLQTEGRALIEPSLDV